MIFLANNQIKTLPLDFFKLSNLTVLSLRAPLSLFLFFASCTDGLSVGNNSLESLPPEIAQLSALKDLDVVNNNLRFLPAEMTNMTLTNLNVHTNPWHPDPAYPATRDASKGVEGTTRVHFCVPPLREVVLRYLLTPSSTNQQRLLAPTTPRLQQLTTLEDRFQLPLQEGALTPTDAELFARLAPTAVSAPRRHAFSRATTSGVGTLFPSPNLLPNSESERRNRLRSSRADDAAVNDQQKSIGRCPSPRHHSGVAAQQATAITTMTWARLGPPFVLPAEERYTWVTELAGVRVGETIGGVPLLWRGCGRSCLDFLDGVGTNYPASVAAAPAAGVQDENKEDPRQGSDGDEVLWTDV
jgi:hypothetical protein